MTTPEQYPLSVNAVVTACNQKTNREPVMSLAESDVQDLLDELVKRHYLRTVSGFGNRVTKYEQRFCNSEFGDLKLTAAEVAIVTTLLLRGAQTPGELRSRAQRMYEFRDMAEVESTLDNLASREDGPYVARLPREPGKREKPLYAPVFVMTWIRLSPWSRRCRRRMTICRRALRRWKVKSLSSKYALIHYWLI